MGFEDEPIDEALSKKQKRASNPVKTNINKENSFSFPRRTKSKEDNNPRLERELK